MLVVPWAWKWSTSLKYFLSISYLWLKKTAVGEMWCSQLLSTEVRQKAGELALSCDCSAVVAGFTHIPSKGLFYFIFLSSSPSYVSITSCTGFCMRKAAECLLVSHLCIACMFLKADRRNNVMGKGRHRFEDQAPRGGGDVRQR